MPRLAGLDKVAIAAALDGVTVYHAGTKWEGDGLVSSGGRVLAVTGVGATLADAVAKAYAGVAKISFDGGAPAQVPPYHGGGIFPWVGAGFLGLWSCFLRRS